MSAPTVILVAGFGDNRTAFDPLFQTRLAQAYRLAAIDLPGFGAPALHGRTTLGRLAEFVDAQARRLGARTVVAHSVASIIASLAAQRPGSPIDTILSLEGNLTADDAYFSGMAAAFEDEVAFRTAFLARLAELAQTDANVERYRTAVASADAQALWELGNEAHAFSAAHTPGDILAKARRVAYFYNPANISAASLAWLVRSNLKSVCLPGASHWMCFDQPVLFAERLIEAIDDGNAD
jgi:pimeloyl-ACP methyl ester carboxylesterase